MSTGDSRIIELQPDLHGLTSDAESAESGYRSTSYVLSTDAGAVLIDVTDPAWLPRAGTWGPPKYLLLTHQHTRWAEAAYEAAFSLRVYLHPDDTRGPHRGPHAGAPAASRYHDPGTDRDLAGLGLRFWHVPGHTPGSVFIYWDRHGGVLFTGDTVVGPTVDGPRELSFPPSWTCDDAARMRRSVRSLELPAVRYILPFHGEPVIAAGDDEGATDLERMWQNLIACLHDRE